MRIGELAKRVGCDTATIRYYERERILPEPGRTRSGYRRYGEDHAVGLGFVLRCRSLGLSLDEIRQLQRLQAQPELACSDVDRLLERHIAAVRERLAALKELELKLLELRRCCGEKTRVADCGILSALRTR
ncbi:Cd(II)/Pb(II)-responsive transcriptional regulator [Martelella alba]|uniref:Cd(II)/Pb(II)-responsive transcriptional regulator n=1 Tax=Martelella alba TaxID=2590451 RepID=A0ABY2SM15_9HYPH|nr:Cd(II)/Pb(II)-responsive transcriptional regulator [Martelella alba]TKI06803.1 Cd(II)/Pb(II)-responsive transcriptional regulator [Martelella alba]